MTAPVLPPLASEDGLDARLRHASQEGRLLEVTALIDQGANVHTCDVLGRSPLHLAAEKGHADVVRMLLICDADAGMQSGTHMTPAHFAAGSGHLAVLSLLLQHGVDLEARNRAGMTPLHLAAWHNHTSALLALLGRGAAIEARDRDRKTPLHLAANGSNGTLLALIERGADVSAKDAAHQTPLHKAAEWGHPDAIRQILQQGVDVSAKDEKQQTPLHLAARNGCVDAMVLLLQSGADFQSVDEKGRTPLYLAASWDRGRAVLALMAWNGSDAPLVLRHSRLDKNSQIRRILKLDALRAAAEFGHLPLLERALQAPELQSLGPHAWSRRLQSVSRHARQREQPESAAYLQARLAHRIVEQTAVREMDIRPL